MVVVEDIMSTDETRRVDRVFFVVVVFKKAVNSGGRGVLKPGVPSSLYKYRPVFFLSGRP